MFQSYFISAVFIDCSFQSTVLDQINESMNAVSELEDMSKNHSGTKLALKKRINI